ncbi:TPA: hypothetical protein DEP96_02080 [Candidatus Uhrbacteria bacterium]|nr:hypothetical protein [Candidatus Uhrbacteria bacterium]
MSKTTSPPQTDAERIANLGAENAELHRQLAEANTSIERLTAELVSLRRGYDELCRSRSGSTSYSIHPPPSPYGD